MGPAYPARDFKSLFTVSVFSSNVFLRHSLVVHTIFLCCLGVHTIFLCCLGVHSTFLCYLGVHTTFLCCLGIHAYLPEQVTAGPESSSWPEVHLPVLTNRCGSSAICLMSDWPSNQTPITRWCQRSRPHREQAGYRPGDRDRKKVTEITVGGEWEQLVSGKVGAGKQNWK